MNQNIEAFLKVLDPEDNSTGGGTASAIAGAMGGALVAMVARLSIGKEGMEEEIFYKEIIQESEELSRILFDGGRQDSLAFTEVSHAYSLPKDSDQEKATRSKRIQETMILATHVPLRNAGHCMRILEMMKELKGRSNLNAASDLECAGYLAEAGLKGCIANVEIILPHIKDYKVVDELANRSKEILGSLRSSRLE